MPDIWIRPTEEFGDYLTRNKDYLVLGFDDGLRPIILDNDGEFLAVSDFVVVEAEKVRRDAKF